MDKATLAILLTLVVHVLGIAVLFWLAFDGGLDWRTWWPGDGDGGGGGGDEPPAGEPEGPRGGVPLDDALPAGVRLRTEHERLRRRRVRRPRHAPRTAPAPARDREPGRS